MYPTTFRTGTSCVFDEQGVEGGLDLAPRGDGQILERLRQVPPRQRRRLLFVVNDTLFFLSHRLPLALEAQRRGFEVHVASPVGEGLTRLHDAGLRHHPLPLARKGLNPARELWLIASLVRLMLRIRPVLVHNVTIKPVLYGSLAARATGVKRVVNAVSGLGYVFLARGWAGRLVRTGVVMLYRVALSGTGTRVIFQNPDDAEQFVSSGLLRQRQVVVIEGGSGVDLLEFRQQPQPPPPLLVMLPARMLSDKGVREFVEAATAVKRQRPSVRFALVGPTDMENPAAISEDELRGWISAGSVEWWGHRADMSTVLASSHVVCLPSYREGMPKVLLEAAATGRAVITTDVPGCRHAIIPGETGLLVPLRDSGALATAILQLVDEPELRMAMGQQGRGLAERMFAIESVVRTTMGVYESMLS